MENVVPLLVYLACPLGMALLLWLMTRGQTGDAAGSRRTPSAGAAAGQPVADTSQGDEVTRLRARLRDLDAQQAGIAAHLARLSAADKPAVPAGAARIDPVPPAPRPVPPPRAGAPVRSDRGYLGEHQAHRLDGVRVDTERDLWEGSRMNKRGGLCLNWKVVVGLAVVGLGVWVVAPNVSGAVLPLLLVAACPLSMLLMMRGMQGAQCAAPGASAEQPVRTGLTREEQLADLKAQLRRVQAQQESIAHAISQLETAQVPAEHGGAVAVDGPEDRAQGRHARPRVPDSQ